MADCYIVRRGGKKNDTDIMMSYGYAGLISPIEDCLTGGEIQTPSIIPEATYLADTIYQQGELWDTTPAERISVVDLSTPVSINGFTASSAVKIYGASQNSITYGWDFKVNIDSPKVCGIYVGVSAEGSTYDLAYVELNGTQIGSYTTSSGKLTTHEVLFDLTDGENTITVKYRKDGSTSTGDDCVYIYGIVIGYLGII